MADEQYNGNSIDEESFSLFSWKLIPPDIAIKTLDKSAFLYMGSGIPEKFREFFGIENFQYGDKKTVELVYGSEKFQAYFTARKRNSTTIQWHDDFRSVIQQKYPLLTKHFLNNEAKLDFYPEVEFSKGLEDNLLKIKFIGEDIHYRSLDISNSIIFAKIAWSKKRWNGFDEESSEDSLNSGYSYVKEHGIAHEWWNFYDFGDDYYYGWIVLKGNPSKFEKNGLILFASVNPETKKFNLIGFYGSTQYGSFKPPINPVDMIKDVSIKEKYKDKHPILNSFPLKAKKELSTALFLPLEFDLDDINQKQWGQAAYMYVGEEKPISKKSVRKLLEKVIISHQSLLNKNSEETNDGLNTVIEKTKRVLSLYFSDTNGQINNLKITPESNEISIDKDIKNEDQISENGMKKQVILYGPPGTGKTYSSVLRAHEIIFGYFDPNITYSLIHKKLNEENKKEIDYSQLSWLQAIVLAFDEIGKNSTQVNEIKNTDTIKKFSAYKNSRAVSNTIWYILQAESKMDSITVNTKNKSGKEYFDKDSESNWYLTEKGLEYQKRLIEDLTSLPEISTSQFNFITFHQSFAYEDFIEGIRPTVIESEDSSISYQIKDGIFKEICRKAALDSTNNYVLIIDEINRGNISKIFGELITLLEDNKRAGESEEITVKLPYSGQDFSVPTNVYIIGTMNSTDKSIALVDIALRRRFHFERLNVDYELIKNHDAKEFLQELNGIIRAIKNPDYEIGHYYFMNIPQNDPDNIELQKVFATRILPLLEEYFFNDWEALATILGRDSIRVDKKKKIIWDEDSGRFEEDSGDSDLIYGLSMKESTVVFHNTMKNFGLDSKKSEFAQQ